MDFQNLNEDMAVNPAAQDDRIKLPFPTAALYWRAGDPRMKELGGTKHFGGWNMDFEKNSDIVEDFGVLPNSSLETFMGDDGEYAVHGTRSIIIAPIRTRKKWLKGERNTIQMLCLIGKKNSDGNVELWGPAILGSRGYAVTYLLDTVREWQRHTKDAREQWAKYKSGKVIQSWYFWSFVGTFGDFALNMKGKNAKSHVSQARIFKADISTEEKLVSYYVGDDNFSLINALYKQAEDWATDEEWLTGVRKEIPLPKKQISKPDWTDESAAADMGVPKEGEIPF